MPELPEVETIRLTIEPKLLGKKIVDGEVSWPKLITNFSVDEFLDRIKGCKIMDLSRRGKYLLIRLNNSMYISIHLRMTGQLTVVPTNEPITNATYLRLKLDDGNELRFRDQRKFGRVMLFKEGETPGSIKKLGPEPLAPEFTVEILQKQFANRKLAIKKALLDQTIIAGIGNIYADEALFLAGIHPARLINSLTEEDYQCLYQSIRRVLSEGISHRGTTKRNYRDADGNPGSYQELLRVYGRKGQPCQQCQNMIVKMNFGGRGTHFCPMCQR